MIEKIQKLLDNKKVEYAFSIRNLKTGETYNYNERKVVSSASTIKIIIMGEIMRQVKEGMLSLNQRIIVREEDKVPFSILTMLETGNSYSLKDVITLMIVQSDNTATNILINIAGMDKVNLFAREMGLKNTILQRKMMDFSARQEGRDNYTTSSDMLYFLECLYNGRVIDRVFDNLMLDIMKLQLDRTMIYIDVPDDVSIAHKSGELDNLDHEVGICFTEKSDYAFSILTWNAESNNYARKTVGNIAKIMYDYFQNN